jgi:multiple sugar transport system substrate-binding protein
MTLLRFFCTLVSLAAAGCGAGSASPVLTIAASAVGAEAVILRRQLARFETEHGGMRVEIRATPDAGDLRHQLYVQWLNARATEPDVLQLDVIWTAEFAGAGWILPLDRFGPAVDEFFPAAVAANQWQGRIYALPWFIDVGMLYWRTDLMNAPPADFAALVELSSKGSLRHGFVWQGARYEGLVTVFVEHLGAFGGRILDESGRVAVDSDAAVRALEFMRDSIYRDGAVPLDVLGWQEEHTRFAFQNGQALFMRNWPYAVALLQDARQSAVAGRFAVAPMPAADGGSSTAALGGSQLAVNARSMHPEAAYALIDYLLAPAQMIERVRVAGQYPSRPGLYDSPELADALQQPPQAVREIIDRAVFRPVTPVYSELSELLQVHLHRALSRQEQPRAALAQAAEQMRTVLRRAGLAPGASSP